jgi:Protein of unknown function (DUF2911)
MTYALKSALVAFGTIFTISNIAPPVKADTWNKETVVTFSAPVEVPGKNLPAGTYVFKLADTDASRRVVEIFTKDRQHLVTRFIAIPGARFNAAETAIVTVQEEPAGTPEAVKRWFYPGDNKGLEFVYAK